VGPGGARRPGGAREAWARPLALAATAREEQLHYRDFDAFPVSSSQYISTSATMRVLSSLLDSTFLENALFETKPFLKKSTLNGPRRGGSESLLNSNPCCTGNRHHSITSLSLVRSVALMPVGASRPNLNKPPGTQPVTQAARGYPLTRKCPA
jgi:hypothetical protein